MARKVLSKAHRVEDIRVFAGECQYRSAPVNLQNKTHTSLTT